jgi:hypothetical protein
MRDFEMICDSVQSSTFSKECERSDYLFWRSSVGVPDDMFGIRTTLNKAMTLSNGSERLPGRSQAGGKVDRIVESRK